MPRCTKRAATQNLPPEILEHILSFNSYEFAPTQKHTLKACLVSRKWAWSAQRLLWRKIELISESQVDKMLLSDACGRYSTSLLEVRAWNGRRDGAACKDLLRKLYGVRNLRFVADSPEDLKLLYSDAFASVSVLELHMKFPPKRASQATSKQTLEDFGAHSAKLIECYIFDPRNSITGCTLHKLLGSSSESLRRLSFISTKPDQSHQFVNTPLLPKLLALESLTIVSFFSTKALDELCSCQGLVSLTLTGLDINLYVPFLRAVSTSVQRLLVDFGMKPPELVVPVIHYLTDEIQKCKFPLLRELTIKTLFLPGSEGVGSTKKELEMLNGRCKWGGVAFESNLRTLSM